MGTPHFMFSDKATARACMESILESEVDPKPIGQVLAHNIVLGLENTAPSYASAGFMQAMAWHLNGKKLSDRLDLPESGTYYQLLVYGYCFLVMLIAYSNRVLPVFDLAWIKLRRKVYYKIITDKDHGLGEESLFDFKYVPWFTRTTKLSVRKERKTFSRAGVETLAQLGVLLAFASVVSVCYGVVVGTRILGQLSLYVPAA